MPKEREGWNHAELQVKASHELLTQGIAIEYPGKTVVPHDLTKQKFWWNTSFKDYPGRFTPTKAIKGLSKKKIGSGILGMTTKTRKKFALDNLATDRDLTPGYELIVQNSLDAIMRQANIEPSTVKKIVVEPFFLEGAEAFHAKPGSYRDRRVEAAFNAMEYLASSSHFFVKNHKIQAFSDAVQQFSSKVTFHMKSGITWEAKTYHELPGLVGGFSTHTLRVENDKLTRESSPCSVILGSKENPQSIHEVVGSTIHESVESELGAFLCDHMNRKYKKISLNSPQVSSYLYEHGEVGELLTQAITEHALEDITNGKKKRDENNPFTAFVRKHDIHGTLEKYKQDPEQFLKIWKEWKKWVSCQ